MKLKYYGHACFSLSYEGGPTLVIDPFDETVTYPPCDEICDAALLSHDHFDHNHVQTLRGDFVTIRSAGAYDVQGVRITAVDSFHDKKGGALRGKNLILRIEGGGLTIVHLGDLGHMPDEKQLEVAIASMKAALAGKKMPETILGKDGAAEENAEDAPETNE